jgi:ribose transport system substrate-binding protein
MSSDVNLFCLEQLIIVRLQKQVNIGGKMKKQFLGLALIAVIGLAGCNGNKKKAADNAAGASADAGSGTTVGIKGSPDESYYMCVMNSGVEYWYPCYAGMKDACKALGVNCYYMGTPEYDIKKEVDVFDQILAMKPTGIIVHPMTAEGFVDPIKRAEAQGTQVVTFAADSPASERTAYVTSDNVKEGNTAAKKIAEGLGGRGEVMILRNPGQTNHETRCNSFISYLKANYPDIKVVADEISNQNADKAHTSVLTVAQANPDLKAVFSPEATSAVGAAQAGIELGNGKQALLIACCDTSEEVLDLIKAGKFFFAIEPDQYLQGYMAMLNAFFAAHNDMLRPMNSRAKDNENLWQIPYCDNGLSIVTKDNADSFYLDAYCKKLGYSSINDMLGPYKVEK